MSLDFFRHVAEQAARFTDVLSLHLLGEPLLHPELDRIVELCAGIGLRIQLVSNGLALSGAREELLLHPVFQQLSFSLHSFRENFPERDPGEYLERIFRLAERALRERPELYINFRFWDQLGAAQGPAPDDPLLQRVEARFGAFADRELDLRRQKSRLLRGRLYAHFDSRFSWPGLEQPERGSHGSCYGLRSHIGILSDGRVVPCCLDHRGVIELGNLHDSPLHEILHSERALRIRKGFLERRLEEELCRRCRYIERFG